MLEDNAIIDLFWARSEDAISQMKLKYDRYCFQIAWNILYNNEDSDECVNDTCLQTWNAIPPQKPGILKSFIGKITRNIALNRYEEHHAQKRGGGQVSLCLDELSELLAGEEHPERIVESMAITQCLNTFLEELGQDERLVFMKRYWYMYSIDEICSQMGFGQSKVKMMLSRTRDKLKIRLEKEELL